METQEGQEPQVATSQSVEDPAVTEAAQTAETPSETTEASGGTQEPVDETSKKESQEWLIPNRARNQEELIASYKALEQGYSRKANEIYQLKQQLQKQQRNVAEETKQFAAALEKDPVEAIRNVARTTTSEVQEQVRAVKFEGEYLRLKDTNAEFRQLEPLMAQVAADNLDIIEQAGLRNDPRLLSILFNVARGIKATETTEAARTQGKKAGVQEAERKAKARLETPSGSGSVSEAPFEKLSLAEMEKRLPKRSSY